MCAVTGACVLCVHHHACPRGSVFGPKPFKACYELRASSYGVRGALWRFTSEVWVAWGWWHGAHTAILHLHEVASPCGVAFRTLSWGRPVVQSPGDLGQGRGVAWGWGGRGQGSTSEVGLRLGRPGLSLARCDAGVNHTLMPAADAVQAKHTPQDQREAPTPALEQAPAHPPQRVGAQFRRAVPLGGPGPAAGGAVGQPDPAASHVRRALPTRSSGRDAGGPPSLSSSSPWASPARTR
jgi:hypothetical protein